MQKTRKFKLACLASGMAALVMVLPAARAVRAKRLASVAAAQQADPEDGAGRQCARNAAKFATNAAYFDGVLQGRLTASQNLERRAPMGRWSAPADKEAFATGYQDGFEQALAENKLPLPVQ